MIENSWVTVTANNFSVDQISITSSYLPPIYFHYKQETGRKNGNAHSNQASCGFLHLLCRWPPQTDHQTLIYISDIVPCLRITSADNVHLHVLSFVTLSSLSFCFTVQSVNSCSISSILCQGQGLPSKKKKKNLPRVLTDVLLMPTTNQRSFCWANTHHSYKLNKIKKRCLLPGESYRLNGLFGYW